MTTSMQLSPKDRMIRTKIGLQRDHPFWGYLSYFVKVVEDKENKHLSHMPTMAVTADNQLIYNPKFVDELTESELTGVWAHEIMHLVLMHLTRRGDRHPLIWNIAADVVVNYHVCHNGFDLPKDCIKAHHRNDTSIVIPGLNYTVHDVDKKTTEQIYDEIYDKFPKITIRIDPNGDGDGDDDQKGQTNKYGQFDVHVENVDSEAERKEIEQDWENKVVEAAVHAKQRGKLPGSFESFLDKLREHKIHWKTLLKRYVHQSVPKDWTWQRRDKKTLTHGIYLPDTVKEGIDVVVGIDTSGSVSDPEVAEFISEIVGMARAYQTTINFRILTHDVNVQDDFEVKNGNIDKIKAIRVRGRGGTSHTPIFDYIKDKIPTCKVAVFFTDGYSDLHGINFREFRFDKIVVINKGGSTDQLKGKPCRTVKMEV